jgi:hypothetical protein
VRGPMKRKGPRKRDKNKREGQKRDKGKRVKTVLPKTGHSSYFHSQTRDARRASVYNDIHKEIFERESGDQANLLRTGRSGEVKHKLQLSAPQPRWDAIPRKVIYKIGNSTQKTICQKAVAGILVSLNFV